MKFSYSIEQVKTAEKTEIKSGTDPYMLMQRAAQALATLTAEKTPDGAEILFVCGGGNNGGDGFAAAQILYEKGFNVSVLCLAKRFSAECSRAKADFRGEILGRIPRKKYPVIVECLFGTGIESDPEGDAKTLIEFINMSGEYILSCDLPGGLGENGVAYHPCVRADCTLVVGGLKNAVFMADGRDFSGEIRFADIGLRLNLGMEIWEESDVVKYFPKRKSNVNKGDFGIAAIYAGTPEYPGAAFLAAEASLKSGVGYTKMYASEPFFSQAVGRLPSVILRHDKDFDEEMLSANAIALGVGTGMSEGVYGLINKLLKRYEGTLILDADALNTLSKFGTEILKEKKCHVIITPHIKEFSRLVKRDVQEILQKAVNLAQDFASEFKVCVVLKNNATVICDGNRTAINLTGSPALAKGGSGDVLCGFLCGTCARGISPYEAACISTFLFGRAGELAAREMGEYSPCASDIIERLPKIILNFIHSFE